MKTILGHSRHERLFCCLLSLLLAVGVARHVQAVTTTTVQDVVYRADGQPAKGTLVISWTAFTTADNLAVAAGSMSIAIGSQGAISIALVPNAGGTPDGTYYRVVYKLDDGSTSEEYWSVPATGTTTIAAVRSKIVPSGVAMQVASRQYVDNAMAATVKLCTASNPQTCVSATASAGGTVYLAAGTYTGPITLPDNGICVNLVGAGVDVTTLTVASPVTAVIAKGNASLPNGCRISDLTIDGNLEATYGLQLLRGKGWHIERVKIKRVVADTGEGAVFGEALSASAEFYEARIRNVTVAYEAGDYAAAHRPLNGLHFLYSGTDNQVSDIVAYNMMNAGIVDDGGDNQYARVHVYGFPLLLYYPNYAMEVLGNAHIVGLTADGVDMGGVHVRGNGNSITNSTFQWPTAPTNGQVSGAFPIVAEAGTDYNVYRDNIVHSASGLVISGVGAIFAKIGSSYFPGNNTEIAGNVNYNDPSDGAFVAFYPVGFQVTGAVTPNAGYTFVTPFNSKATIAVRKKSGQTSDLLDCFDTDGTSKLCSVDGAGNAVFASITSPLTGNASTATALAAAGTECPSGQAPRGVDARGNALDCFIPSGSGDATTIQGRAVDSGVASASAGQIVGVVAPNGNSIKAQTKPVLEVRDYQDTSGNTVDCTGTADSSAAMNSLTATQDVSTEKTISTRGCPKIRLDSQWLIHAQLGLEIDLGGTMYSGGAVQGGTLIFGCNGSAGALIRIDRSGYVYMHGGTIEAKGPSCASDFTGSIVTTNNGSGGYTQTRNKFSDMFLTTNIGGTAIPGYFGFKIEGIPNMEGYGLHHVYINCFNSSGSYGFWSTGGNADSTVIDDQSNITLCYQGVRMEGGDVYIHNSHVGANGGYSVFGAGGATFFESLGCIMTLQGVVVSENSGQLFNSNNDGTDNCGNSRTWVGNQFSFDDIDPAVYPVNINSGKLYFSSNWFKTTKALAAIHNSVLIGTDVSINSGGPSIIDGGNNTTWSSGGVLIPLKSIPTHLSTGSNNNYNWTSATDRTSGFTLRPLFNAASNSFGSPSPTITLQTSEWSGSVPLLGGFTFGVTSRNNVGLGHTLAFAYTSPSGLNGKAAIALGAPLSGLQTVAVATPGTPTITQSGTGGSISYSYKVVARAGYGTSAASAAGSTATGNATLSGSNCNVILWNDAGSQTGMGAWGFDIYRTASGGTPSTTGLIATVSALDAAAAAAASLNPEYQAADCGLEGDGSTPPTSSTADGSVNIPAGATYKKNGIPFAASDLSNGTVGSGSIVLASGVLGTGPAVLATGNVATATALAATPSQCSTHNFATGVTAGGNANCTQPAAADINGLGGAATLNVGTVSGTVAAGDDSRFNCDVSKNPCRVAATSLTGQTASIGNTTLYTPSVAGQYRVVLSLWTMAAGTSGTVSFSLSANTGSGAESFGSASLDLTKVNSGGQVSGQWNMHVDANQAISYNTTLTCSSCGSPQYGIDVVVERLQ